MPHNCLAPRPLSLDENVRAKESGKETYPSHGSLRFITGHSRKFRARLYDEKNEAPEEEAGLIIFDKVNNMKNLCEVRPPRTTG